MRQSIPLRIFQGPTGAERGRNTSRPIVLIGFQHQGNLGLGYLTSVLRQYGYAVQVLDVEADPEEILKSVVLADPLLVGFSLIFQFYIERYGGVERALRAPRGVLPVALWGHFSSVWYQPTLVLMTVLANVVRCRRQK